MIELAPPPASPPSHLNGLRVFRGFILGALCVLIGVILGLSIGKWEWGPHALADLGPAPIYTLTNQLGEKVASQQLLGKVQIVTFLFPYCTTYCPLVTAHLIGFEHLLSQLGVQNRVAITAFNIAPDAAGLVPMRKFLSQYGWDPKDLHWQFLTGTKEQIRRVVTNGFHVDYQRLTDSGNDSQVEISLDQAPQLAVANPLAEKHNPGFDISHSDDLLIVDGKGHIRKIYDDADVVSNEQLWNDISLLLKN